MAREEKSQTQDFLLATSAAIPDADFFIRREVLAWKAHHPLEPAGIQAFSFEFGAGRLGVLACQSFSSRDRGEYWNQGAPRVTYPAVKQDFPRARLSFGLRLPA